MGRFGGFELGFGSDADVMFVHDPLPGAAPRGRRRGPRTTWPTSCAGCSRSRAPTRRSRWTPACGPRASRARWCGRWTPTPPTTPSGRRSGRRRRCCGPTAMIGDRDLCARFTALDRPAAVPGRRDQRGRRPRDPPDQGAGRRRAAAARRRPEHAPQARSRRPRRRGVDRAAAADAARRQGRGAAHHAHPRRPRPRRSTRSCSTLADAQALATAWRTASGLRNAITQVRGRPADSLPRDAAGACRRRAHPRLRAGGVRRAGQRLPAGDPARPAGRRAGLLGLTGLRLGSGAPRTAGSSRRRGGPRADTSRRPSRHGPASSAVPGAPASARRPSSRPRRRRRP